MILNSHYLCLFLFQLQNSLRWDFVEMLLSAEDCSKKRDFESFYQFQNNEDVRLNSPCAAYYIIYCITIYCSSCFVTAALQSMIILWTILLTMFKPILWSFSNTCDVIIPSTEHYINIFKKEFYNLDIIYQWLFDTEITLVRTIFKVNMSLFLSLLLHLLIYLCFCQEFLYCLRLIRRLCYFPKHVCVKGCNTGQQYLKRLRFYVLKFTTFLLLHVLRNVKGWRE